AFSVNLGIHSITRADSRGIIEGLKSAWNLGIKKLRVFSLTHKQQSHFFAMRDMWITNTLILCWIFVSFKDDIGTFGYAMYNAKQILQQIILQI
ncbi:hypothetical protein LINPERPRIM_LOCUS16556, partial [Linum perenne]